jgi:ketosteroid isomerase-like protein
LGCFILVGCGGRLAASNPNTTSDRVAILEAMDATWKALGHQSLDDFNRHAAADFHLYSARANRINSGQLFSNHRQNMTDFAITTENVVVHLQGDLAWVTYDGTMSGLWGGATWGGDFLFTSIFVREPEGWKLAHTHESRKPDA